ncbi:hypothetical protein [Ekhidna sp.]|uniref:hypothetical protein n=1 Tax=Ekhidna sp. TaxID=2608089 RepID=UPI0032969254
MKYFYLLLTTVILACTSSSGNEETTSKDEVLLYLTIRDSNYDIFKNDLKGTEVRLTTNTGFDYSPMWNEGLNKIIYYSYVNDSFQIASKDLGGRDVLLNTYGQTEFNLSPSGQFLINQVQVGDTSILILSNLRGSEVDTIASSGLYNGRAKWSWESDKIAYISDRDGNNEVFVYDLKDASTIRLTTNDTFEKYITWEVGGNRLAYTTQYYEEGTPGRNDVFVYDFSNGDTNQITDNPYNDTELAWSPISGRIAFHSTREGSDHIYVMNSDGSNQLQITNVGAYHGEPCWAWE